MKSLLLGAAAVLALGITAASAQTVKFEGCAVQPQPHCTMINPVSGSYVVNSAKRPVPVGKPIRLTGTAEVGPTPCGVVALRNIKWKPSKKKTCN